MTFYVEAHHTANTEGDDFVFAYSTDDVSYTEMLTVSKTADDNSAQYYTLPSGLSGSVYIRVHDFDATPGNSQLDSIYIDELIIESETSSLAPTVASQPTPVDGATDVDASSALSWTAGLYAASHDVYLGTNQSPSFVSNQSGTVYDSGNLLNSTTDYWSITEVNATGTTNGPIWSFTTGAELDFEASAPSSSTLPNGWSLVTVAGAPTFSTTAFGAGSLGDGSSGGMAGSVSSTDYIGSPRVDLAGAYLVRNTNLDLTTAVTVSFDFQMPNEGTWDDAVFLLGAIDDGLSAVSAGELLSTKLGEKGGSSIGTGLGRSLDRLATTSTNLKDDTWYHATATWSPTSGATGTLTVTVSDFTGDVFTLVSSSYSFDSSVGQVGLGSVNDTIRFDNLTVW